MQRKTKKTISVIIPLYNQGKYVEEALYSVFNQTHPVNEIIVVNDGSTDNSLEVINPFRDKIIIIDKPHSGILDTVNEGLKKATGNFISFLDADDRWTRTKTEIQLQLLCQNPNIDMLFGCAQRFCMIVENNIETEKNMDVLPGNTRVGGLFKKELFEKIAYQTAATNAHEFMDWLNRAKEAGRTFMNHTDVVFERRIHDSNDGIRNKELQRQQYFASIKAALDRRRAKENK